MILQVITEVQEGDKADVNKAVKAANEAFRLPYVYFV
jgi:hypothetical protein